MRAVRAQLQFANGRGLTKFCGGHEIFTTKIKIFSEFEHFTKILCRENIKKIIFINHNAPLVVSILNVGYSHATFYSTYILKYRWRSNGNNYNNKFTTFV